MDATFASHFQQNNGGVKLTRPQSIPDDFDNQAASHQYNKNALPLKS